MRGNLACQCCERGDIHDRLKSKIRMLEQVLGVRILVIKGYACNDGDKDHHPVRGTISEAADIVIPGWQKYEAREFVEPYFGVVEIHTEGVERWTLHVGL